MIYFLHIKRWLLGSRTLLPQGRGNFRFSRFAARATNLCRALAALLCFFLIDASGALANTITKCGALTDPPNSASNPATPAQAPAIECPNPPCAQNACQIQRKYSGAPDFTYTIDYGGGQEYQTCGAFTACVLQGEDPPLNNPWWDESSMGYMVLGSGLLSGKCAPPKADGSDNTTTGGGSATAPTLICPATPLGSITR